jgi:nucleoside-diphosphate kinase
MAQVRWRKSVGGSTAFSNERLAAPPKRLYKAAHRRPGSTGGACMLFNRRKAQPAGVTTMAVERTLSIIKPDATRRNLTGKINAKFEDGGLRIVAQKRVQLSKAQAEQFYGVHRERPFFNDLVSFMISGPVVLQVLEGENAIARNREIMGATNPANAAEGTIRKEFAESIEANSVHGSDAPDTAAQEIAFFFAGIELVG